jgi:hypothetical protein
MYNAKARTPFVKSGAHAATALVGSSPATRRIRVPGTTAALNRTQITLLKHEAANRGIKEIPEHAPAWAALVREMFTDEHNR